MSDSEEFYDYESYSEEFYNYESYSQEEEENYNQQQIYDSQNPKEEQFNTPEALKQIQDDTGLNKGQAYKVLQQNEFNFEKVKKVKLKDYEEFISESNQYVNTDYCIKCLKKNTQLDSLGCNHNFCYRCYRNYIQKIFNSGDENYIIGRCPYESCQLTLDQEKFQKFLDDEQIQQYYDQMLNFSIEIYPFIRKHKCQNDGCNIQYFSYYTHKQLYQPDFSKIEHFKDHCGSFICNKKHVLINCVLYQQWQDLLQIFLQNFKVKGEFMQKFSQNYIDATQPIKIDFDVKYDKDNFQLLKQMADIKDLYEVIIKCCDNKQILMLKECEDQLKKKLQSMNHQNKNLKQEKYGMELTIKKSNQEEQNDLVNTSDISNDKDEVQQQQQNPEEEIQQQDD